MIRFRKSALVAMISLAAFLAAVPGTAGERVLCIGEDGHVSLEAARNGVCGFIGISAPAGISTAGQTRSLTSCQQVCGPCADVPVLSATGTISISPSHERAPLADSPASIAKPSNDPHPSADSAKRSFPVKPPEREDATLAALRTTVLLI